VNVRLELAPDGLCDEEEYPEDVRTQFGFTWKYVILEAPEASANVMTAPMLQREKKKIGGMIQEFRSNAAAILRVRGHVSAMAGYKHLSICKKAVDLAIQFEQTTFSPKKPERFLCENLCDKVIPKSAPPEGRTPPDTYRRTARDVGMDSGGRAEPQRRKLLQFRIWDV